MRFGVEEREPPGIGSSGGAEGDRIAARECGEGIVAVWGLLRPGTGGQVVVESGSACLLACLLWCLVGVPRESWPSKNGGSSGSLQLCSMAVVLGFSQLVDHSTRGESESEEVSGLLVSPPGSQCASPKPGSPPMMARLLDLQRATRSCNWARATDCEEAQKDLWFAAGGGQFGLRRRMFASVDVGSEGTVRVERWK